jgi:hypothetical protein
VRINSRQDFILANGHSAGREISPDFSGNFAAEFEKKEAIDELIGGTGGKAILRNELSSP